VENYKAEHNVMILLAREFPSHGRGHRFNPYCAAIKMIPLSWHSLQHPAAPAEAAI
jgi:hypothetical protein